MGSNEGSNAVTADSDVIDMDEIKRRHTANAVDARDQADEFDGFLHGDHVTASKTGEQFYIPHKDLFDNGQQCRWDDMLFERESYDREDDITASDGTVIRRGDVKIPFRKNGKRVRSQIDATRFATDAEQQAVAVWGVDEARRADDAGVNFNEIPVAFGKQAARIARWRERDSKSASGDSGVASASNRD